MNVPLSSQLQIVQLCVRAFRTIVNHQNFSKSFPRFTSFAPMKDRDAAHSARYAAAGFAGCDGKEQE
jgi:hypothetical protein